MVRFWKVIHSIDSVSSGLVLGGMILLGFSNVLSRYVLNASLAASEEILTYMLVFVALLASAPGVKRDSHVGMSILVDKSPAMFRKYFVFLKIVSYLIFFGILFYFGIQNAYESWKYGQVDSALGWPAWWFFIAFPIGALFCIFEAVSKFWDKMDRPKESGLNL
ncbi:MAG: TRAP transporter small permease [Deltaproteobacteria bacterium]|nr:TRAP transporter small permease [Deltaproteobacteria bacterium]